MDDERAMFEVAFLVHHGWTFGLGDGRVRAWSCVRSWSRPGDKTNRSRDEAYELQKAILSQPENEEHSQ